jgi:hypothetical protein
MKLPRFTLRELFLLVVIAAMGCGWWAEREKNRAREEDWKAALPQTGGVSHKSKAKLP